MVIIKWTPAKRKNVRRRDREQSETCFILIKFIFYFIFSINFHMIFPSLCFVFGSGQVPYFWEATPPNQSISLLWSRASVRMNFIESWRPSSHKQIYLPCAMDISMSLIIIIISFIISYIIIVVVDHRSLWWPVISLITLDSLRPWNESTVVIPCSGIRIVG